MCEFITTTIANLKSVNWPDLLQGIGSIWVAIVATLALNAWKHQSKAQRQMNFMDELTDSVHEFIQLMSAPNPYNLPSPLFAKEGNRRQIVRKSIHQVGIRSHQDSGELLRRFFL